MFASKKMSLVGHILDHMLDHILDHLIIGLVTTALHEITKFFIINTQIKATV